MTISLSNNSARISYTVAQGATQTSFTVPFEFFDDADINVYVDGTKKTITTHYTVSGGSGSTGSVAISVTGATGGSTVVLTRDIALARTTDFPTSGPFDVTTLNTELDRFTAQLADQKDENDRSITLQDTDSAATMTLPLKDDRKGKYLAFNSSTGVPEVGATIADVALLSTVTSDIAALADIEDGTTATDAISGLAAIKANVTTVAGIASNVTSVAGNASNINAASGHATTATTKASEASTSATASASSATASASSASTSSTKATESSTHSTVSSNFANKTTGTVDDADGNTTGLHSSKAWAIGGTGVTDTAGKGSAKSWAIEADAVDGTEHSAKSYATSGTAISTGSAKQWALGGGSGFNSNTAVSGSLYSAKYWSEASASSATASANSATASANSAAAAASAYDTFDDRYLGSKTSNPTVDNDGNALVTGALYFNSSSNEMRVYDGANWIAASSAGSASLILYEYTATSNQTTFSGSDDNSATLSYSVGNLQVVMNGVILDPSDFTATSGTSVVLASGATTGDLINIYAFKSFTVSDTVSASAGGTFAANVAFTANANFGDNDKAQFGAGSDLQIYHDGSVSRVVNITSNLKLQSDIFEILNESGTEQYINAVYNGAVNLFHNNSGKLATTSTGVDITGTLTSDGLTVDGDVTLNDGSPNLRLQDSDVSRFVDILYGTRVATFRNTMASGEDIDTVEPSMVFSFKDDSETRTGMTLDHDGGLTVTGATVTASGGSASAPAYAVTSGSLGANGLFVPTANTLGFSAAGTERMRIDSNGSILIGRTNTNNNNGGHYITSGYAYLERNNDLPLYLNRFGSDGTIAQFRRQNGIVGDIVVSSSTTTYNTSSDYRLKTAVNYDWDATTRLKQLKPARFKWIVDGDDAVPVDGFLAHEAQTVVPEAVTGTHNEVDDDGNPVHQGIDQSKLVPLLVKTIQELEARITALEAK